MQVKVPVPPRILQRTKEIPKKEIPSEDIEMKMNPTWALASRNR